jgi:hypothetical protein
MNLTHLFRHAVKNPVSVILLLAIECVMIWLIVGDIKNMHEAKTGCDYCINLCYLVENISIGFFICIFFLIAYLTYINKQYSKWIIRLFYILGISSLAYFAVAGHVFDYVFHHVESNYAEKLPSLARTVFTGPVYWIIIGYLFIPKILKDARKMKEEQELTV